MYYVYMHIFPNGKRYIGVTSLKPELRWGANGCNYKNTYMKNAIKKYGWNNIIHKIIACNLTQEEASDMEIALIKKYNSANRLYGYNISLGGINSRKCSDETKEKLRKVNIGKKMSDSTKKKISDFQKGCKRSEETILHMREAQKKNFKNGNNKFHSKESRKKASQSLKGRKPSDLSIQKSSEAKYHKVINIETGKQYKSIKEASQIEKIDRTTISRHCNKKTKIQKWVYVD